MQAEERKSLIKNASRNLKQIRKPGIKPIKQIELATKWRPLVPIDFQDDVCPIPHPDVVAKYKQDKKNKRYTTNNKDEV